MRKYRNKPTKINTNSDYEEEKEFQQIENAPYQEIREYHRNFPTGYEKSRQITSKMQYNDPHNKNNKISSKSEKYYTFYTEASSPKVNFESKNTAKKYMDKRAFTPSRLVGNNYNHDSKSHFNAISNEYFSELREEYTNPTLDNRVNIRKKVYKGNQTPQPYRSNNDNEYKNDEEFLENYGYHETKDIRDKGHKKFDSITHITGYSNLIPLNRLKQCGRIETYSYSSRKEEENKPNFKNAIEKVRELQRGKKEYDEFMKKLGRKDENEERLEKFEKYKQEQIRQQEIREEKIRLERLKQERIREEQMRNEKIRQEKIRQERLRMERIKKEEELKKEKMRNEMRRQEELKQIRIREERIHQEKIRQEKIQQDKIKQQEKLNQEKIRQEKIRQEKIKEEKIRQEKIRQEKLKEERIKQEKIKQEIIKTQPKKVENKNNAKQQVSTYKKIVVNTEVSNPRNDSVTKKFKAHSGKYTYKENITEEINHYRNNSNYNKELNNIARKETVYKNTKKKESTKSYSKLPIKKDLKLNINKSNSRNYSTTNLKTITDNKESNKVKNINTSYQIKTTKTTINNTNIDKNKNIKNYRIEPKKNTNTTSNYTKKSYTSNTTYTNINKIKYPIQTNNNYKKSSMVKIAEKTASLNYPNPNKKIDYSGENYHQDYLNIESRKYGKVANHIHTGLSNDGQYLINMTSAEKISDGNNYNNNRFQQQEKNVEEIVSTIRERKKNLGDNYAFYERKDLQKPDNTSYTIHKRFGERTIYGKEKYETRKVRHYKLKPGEEKYLGYNDEYDGYDVRSGEYEERFDDNGNINYEDDCENINYDYSPDCCPEGEEVHEEYENRIEEYNYEN